MLVARGIGCKGVKHPVVSDGAQKIETLLTAIVDTLLIGSLYLRS